MVGILDGRISTSESESDSDSESESEEASEEDASEDEEFPLTRRFCRGRFFFVLYRVPFIVGILDCRVSISESELEEDVSSDEPSSDESVSDDEESLSLVESESDELDTMGRIFCRLCTFFEVDVCFDFRRFRGT